MRPASPYLRNFLLFLILIATAATEIHAQSVVIPVTTRRGVVFDHAGNYLYIGTSDGLVQRYDLNTNQIVNSFNLGGSLNGIDIAPDDSFLLVAQNNGNNGQGTVHRIDLINGAITNINYPLQDSERGAWAIAIASNEIALVTPQCADNGIGLVRQIDLATNAVTVRSDVPGSGGFSPNGTPTEWVRQFTQIQRSADRHLLYFVEGGSVFTYDANTNTFGPRLISPSGSVAGSAAVSRDGSMLLTRGGSPQSRTASLDRASDYHFIRAFHNQLDSGVAFDSVSDTLYSIDATNPSIVAYDTNTFRERFRLPTSAVMPGQTTQFGTGTLVADQNGRYLASETLLGVELHKIPSPLPGPQPPPVLQPLTDPRDIVFDNASHHLYISTGSGFVFPLNLTTGILEPPYIVGGSLGAIDVSPDDSSLLVSQEVAGVANGMFHKIDLATGSITNIEYQRRIGEALDSEGGALQVAVAGNGFAIATVSYSGGAMPQYFRQIDLATNMITMRSDSPANAFPAFTKPSTALLYPSADRSLVYCLQLTDASEAYNYYSSTNQFGAATTANESPETGAANRDGTLIAHRAENQPTVLQNAASFSIVHSFSGLDSGLAFNATSDVFYGVSTATDEIIGYNTNTFAETLRLPIGEDMPSAFPPFNRFGSGRLVTSHDGRYVALITPTAVRVYDVTLPLAVAPTISPNGGTFRKKVLVTLASATSGATILYTLDGSDPAVSGTVYVTSKKIKGITITGKGAHTLKAIAAKSGFNPSAVSTANFTIK